MNFEISSVVEDLRARIAGFVERDILPLEGDRACYDAHGNIALDVLGRVRDKAKAEGLWTLQLDRPGRAAIGRVGMAVCYEEMNRSIFGPV
eukprot:gene68913-94439_t